MRQRLIGRQALLKKKSLAFGVLGGALLVSTLLRAPEDIRVGHAGASGAAQDEQSADQDCDHEEDEDDCAAHGGSF